MEEPLKIVYSYKFEDGYEKSFDLLIDRKDLGFIHKRNQAPPSWAELAKYRCENCALDSSSKYCPIAVNLADITEGFKDYFSYENVSVTVSTEDRRYAKDTSLQEGLGALIGIIMVTSGCPSMERLKPMVRFHLPFATLMETTFRTISMYLVAQYFLNRDGKPADWNLEGLKEIFTHVGIVNRYFAQRLFEAAKKDANVNALVYLDCFASMVPLSADKIMEEIKQYFSVYS